jgi:hypothetical protein
MKEKSKNKEKLTSSESKKLKAVGNGGFMKCTFRVWED